MSHGLDLAFKDTTHDALPCRGLVVRAFRVARPWLNLPRTATAELGVQVIGPARMRTLNHRWRRRDVPTDVLAFPLSGPRLKGYTGVSLGDLFICPRVVRAKAKAWGNPVKRQMKWTIVHGLLHLAGYDHETGPRNAARMARLEQKILKQLS